MTQGQSFSSKDENIKWALVNIKYILRCNFDYNPGKNEYNIADFLAEFWPDWQFYLAGKSQTPKFFQFSIFISERETKLK